MKFLKFSKNSNLLGKNSPKNIIFFTNQLPFNFKKNKNIFIFLNLTKKYIENINEYSDNPYFSYLFFLNKKKKITFKNSYLLLSSKRNKNTTITKLFLNLIMRHGLKQKIFNIFSQSINNFYLYFYFFNINTNTNYYLERVILSTIPNINGFFFFENILKALISLLSPLFNYKITKLNKKRRKKKNIKYTSKVTYITNKKRNAIVFASLLQYSRIFLNNNFIDRLTDGLFKTFIEQEDSYLYKKKLFSYNKFLKSKVTKVV